MLGVLQNVSTASIGCLVEDISLGGARLCAEEKLVPGDCLRLAIPHFGFTAHVRVVWATTDCAGVAFPTKRSFP